MEVPSIVWLVVLFVLGYLFALLVLIALTVAVAVVVSLAAFAALITILPLAALPAPRTFWLALVARIRKPPADVTDRRFVGPYATCVLVGTVAWSLALLRVQSVLSSVGGAWPVALVAVGVASVVAGAFALARAADLPGGPTSPRAVLEWVTFVAATLGSYVLVAVLALLGLRIL